MLAAVDIEWITRSDGIQIPTQLAAVRMDEKGWMAEHYNCVINSSGLKKAAETKPVSAKVIYDITTDAAGAVKAFFEWLRDDDELLWWCSDTSDAFCQMVQSVGSETEKMRFRFTAQTVSLRDHIYRFIKINRPQLIVPRGVNAYKLASLLKITHKNIPHRSLDDARMICMIIRELHFPRSELDTAPEETFDYSKRQETVLPYQYDEKKRIVHITGCDKIFSGETKGYGSLKKALKKSYETCPCCRREMAAARKDINIDILARFQTNYAYSKGSAIFHTTDCRMLYRAKQILSVNYYDTCIEKGLRPCLICKPQPHLKEHDKTNPLTSQIIKTEDKYGLKEKKALRRYYQAISDRKMFDKRSSPYIKNSSDVFILTHPANVFWAAAGCRSFHLRNCSKTMELQNLYGFSRYEDAVRAGFKPCRLCRPSKNNDLFYSFPLWSHPELKDDLPGLIERCKELGLNYKITQQFLNLRTPVGRWRIYLHQSPVHLDHINMMHVPCEDEYHRQPRLFFSVTDAVSYILRHDKILTTVDTY